MKRLAIITTHPIQYYAPVFKLLHERKQIEITVFYTWGDQGIQKHDPGFEKLIEWDLPLLEGYPFEWVHNISRNPGSHYFYGIHNPELVQQITQWKPDSILVIGWAYQGHLQVLRHFKGKLPVYFRGDSTLLDETSGLKHFFKSLFLKWVYRNVDHGFYVGTANKMYFLQYGFDETNLSFTPHAVDNNRFAEDRLKEAQELRKKLGLDCDEVLVLYAGKFEPKKDPILLLNAFLKLKNKKVHLLFAGNGILESSLKSQVSNLRTEQAYPNSQTIHFMNFQNQTQIPVLYQACDLFCLPSKGPGESWGLAINEAMACGKAILASDKVGSVCDLVKEGINGSLFKSGNLPDLKEKLEYLTSDKLKLSEYGTKSKQIIKDWNFESTAIGIEKKMNSIQKIASSIDL